MNDNNDAQVTDHRRLAIFRARWLSAVFTIVVIATLAMTLTFMRDKAGVWETTITFYGAEDDAHTVKPVFEKSVTNSCRIGSTCTSPSVTLPRETLRDVMVTDTKATARLIGYEDVWAPMSIPISVAVAAIVTSLAASRTRTTNHEIRRQP